MFLKFNRLKNIPSTRMWLPVAVRRRGQKLEPPREHGLLLMLGPPAAAATAAPLVTATTTAAAAAAGPTPGEAQDPIEARGQVGGRRGLLVQVGERQHLRSRENVGGRNGKGVGCTSVPFHRLKRKEKNVTPTPNTHPLTHSPTLPNQTSVPKPTVTLPLLPSPFPPPRVRWRRWG